MKSLFPDSGFRNVVFCFLILLSFSKTGNAQNQSSNSSTYLIGISLTDSTDEGKIKKFLSEICTSNSVVFDDLSGVFTVSTDHPLDQKVIEGKMQKNYFPVISFKKVGEASRSFPKLQNTGDPMADELNYEQEKAKWIKENPEEYKKMTGNSKAESSVSTTK